MQNIRCADWRDKADTWALAKQLDYIQQCMGQVYMYMHMNTNEYMYMCIHMYLCIHVSDYLFVYISIYLSINLSICLSKDTCTCEFIYSYVNMYT